MMTGKLGQLPASDGWGVIVLDKPNEMDWEVILVHVSEFERASIDAKVGLRVSCDCRGALATNLRVIAAVGI